MSLSKRSFVKAMVAACVSTAFLPLSFASEQIPSRWDEQTDVVIVGSGFAGMAAAAEALTHGAKVIVFEKMPVAGGNSAIAGGGYAAWTDKENRREKLNLGEDSEERHYKDTLKGGDYYNLPELVSVLVKNAPDAMNWMLDQGGLTLNPGLGRVGGHTAYRDHMATGARYLQALTTIAKKHGFTKVQTRNEVIKLWKDDKGRIVGVEVKNGSKTKNVKANKGVVLAAGGFAGDVDYRTKHVPSLGAGYNTTNHKGVSAKTLQMAQEAGADTLQLSFIQLFPTGEAKTGRIDRPALFPIQFPGYGALYVNNKGKRFVSELERRDVVAQAELNTGDKNTWCIFNAQVFNKLTDKNEIDKFVKTGRVLEGSSISELAAKMGVPAQSLEETIKQHNDFLKNSKDTDFGKPISAAMSPMTEGPFYAVSQWPSVHHTEGGVRINPEAQVIDIHGKVIPGLYAAGEFTGGVHGNNRLGGNAIADCIVFGRIAGKNAAKEH